MPEFHQGHIALIRRIPVSVITGNNNVWDSKQGWFEYFWAEAYGVKVINPLRKTRSGG